MKRALSRVLMLVLFILVFFPGVKVYAKSDDVKTIQVPISKTYKSAKFTLLFDYYDDYSVVVLSPDGIEYKGTLAAENTVECVVNTVEAGQWQVVIKKTEMSGQQDQTTEGAEDAPDSIHDTQSTNREQISPVRIQVEGSMENLIDVSRDITVATDIAGLKMYLKDDSFIAEWTDTTCGNVNIEVVNAKNLQKIDSQTIQGNSYTCPLDKSVEEIMVTLVPAVSSSVEGAANTYTFKNNNHPNATVTYEDLKITNHGSLKVVCELKDRYAIKILANGKQTELTSMLNPGTYEYEVPIDVGTNEILTYIVDSKGNMRSTPYSVEKDVIAPQLELVSSYEDIVTEDEYLTIEGRVDDFNKLMINNAEITVEGDNTFRFPYKLKEGVNQIAIVATDAAGNETVYDIAAERIIPEEKPIPWLKIIICASLTGILVIYILEVLRRKRNPEKYVRVEEEEHSEYDDIDISKMTKREKKEIVKGPHPLWDILSFGVPVLAVYVFLTYIVMVSVVSSGSMEPTLGVGNTVFYNRLAYVTHEPQRGDAIVFYSAEYGTYFGKRIIGLPGDKIKFRDGYVVINDQYCDETAYINPSIETNCSKEFEVPDGCYFVLGDNRERSNDSRYWEEPYISRDAVIGKYMGQIQFSFQYDILAKIGL